MQTPLTRGFFCLSSTCVVGQSLFPIDGGEAWTGTRGLCDPGHARRIRHGVERFDQMRWIGVMLHGKGI